MTVKNVSNLAASVQARLQNHARTTKRPFQELLQYYAMERFLYRLPTSPQRASFILKGALMLLSALPPEMKAVLPQANGGMTVMMLPLGDLGG